MFISSMKQRLLKIFSVFTLLIVLTANYTTISAISVRDRAKRISFSIPHSADGVCPSTINFGEIIECSIDLPAEIDQFSFTAQTGDHVQIIMTDSGDMFSGVEIRKNGEIVGNCQSNGATTSVIDNCILSEGGSYQIFTYDGFNRSKTGQYYLSLINLNATDSRPITFGQILTDTITLPSQTIAYQFSAKAGAHIQVTMTDSGDMFSGVEVRKNGEIVGNCRSNGSATSVIDNCVLPEDGTYRIFTYDGFNRSKRGQYDLSLICLTPICDCVEPDCEISRQPPLVLIYAVLDNNLGDDPDNLERLINNAEAGVHDDVRVRLLIDTPGGDGSIIYDLMHDTDPSCPKVGNLTCSGRYVEGENFWRNGDEDTAHPETLYNFVVDAAKTYSDTEKILLSLVGHGSGWSANALPGQPSKWGSQPGEQPNHEERLGGFLWDDTPGDGGTSRSMSTKALGVALDWIKNEIGRPIDLLYLDACSMGMASVAYEVRNSVDYLLASPNTAWASFNYAKMLQETTPDKNAEAIGLAWLEAEAQVLRREQYPFTLSLYNLSKMEEVATAISTMADTLQAAMPGNKTQITQAGAQTERFESNYDGSIATSDHYADQLSFVLHLEEAFSTNDAVKRAVQSTKTALAAFIVKQELHSGKPWLYPPNVWRWQEAGGFSIYLPLEEDDPKRALYTSANLQWAQDTHWDEFLNAYWGGVMLSANANSDVLPTCPSTTDCGPLNKLLPLQPTIYLPLIHQ